MRGTEQVLMNWFQLSPKLGLSFFCRGFEFELTRLGSNESYFKTIAVDLQKKRDFIVKILEDAGMNPVIPEGGYFIMADWSKIGESFRSNELLSP